MDKITTTSEAIKIEANQLRLKVAETLFNTGGGHYGGCFSVMDILLTLYRKQLRVSPDKANAADRDRVILSKGHAALAQYTILQRLGFHSQDLNSYGEFGSVLEGHPDMHKLAGIDFSTGSLGQGLSVGIGMAMGLPATQNVWVILGDGECQEGQIWEAAMMASRYNPSNLKVILDNNKLQEWGYNDRKKERCPLENARQKWQAFGWKALECDGHDINSLIEHFDIMANYTSGPVILIANTIKGKGSEYIEQRAFDFHCCDVSAEENNQIIRELGK